MDMPWWVELIIGFLCHLIGFFVIKNVFQKQLEKNPPINRDMIRAMFRQMGRKPSERDITRVLEEMNKYK